MNTLFEIENYKVLTLYQPWASLLVHGIKKIETRPKPTTWTAEKGSYLIHAAKQWTKDQFELCLTEPFFSELCRLGYYQRINGKQSFTFPTSHIIGSIEVVGCLKILPLWMGQLGVPGLSIAKNEIGYPEEYFGDYTSGRYAWLTQKPRVLKAPIPYIGGQGYYQNFKWDIKELQFL
jgi:hypothetical protein